MWEGADFTIKIRKVEGYPNYDASTFKGPAPVNGSDDELEAIYNQQHVMAEFTDPKEYKSYADLQKRLAAVLGEAAPRHTMKQEAALELDDEIPTFASTPAPSAGQSAAPAPITTAESSMSDDDTMSYFAKLAADD